eukprot:gene11040-59494_t
MGDGDEGIVMGDAACGTLSAAGPASAPSSCCYISSTGGSCCCPPSCPPPPCQAPSPHCPPPQLGAWGRQ